MANPSNIYAEKIFGEHPIALWALDDKADYISLIPESGRNLANATKWTITNGSAQVVTNITQEPFTSSITNRITGTDSNYQVTAISSNLIKFSQLNSEQATFSIGAYIYDEDLYATHVSIGYEYDDTTSPLQVLKKFDVPVGQRWIFLNETFSFEGLESSTKDIRLVIKIEYNLEPNISSYPFLINGITFGQWAENFQAVSLGVEPINLPSTIALSSSKAIEAKAYGLQDLSAYYIGDSSRIYAKNAGVPLVYGAESTTTIYPIANKPSIIVPGCGVLNKVGQYKNYTVEMWMRINANTFSKKRIFGPIASEDGIYVDGEFLTLRIGGQEESYFVGEWFRPMLLDLRISENSTSLLLNGEEIINFSFITSEMVLPDEFSATGKTQDWLGFYAYDDISPIDIDCIAIYPYVVSSVVAKRRWVYGQAVDFPEKINTAYNGTSVFVDYAFANYANNYLYPDIGSWNLGINDNVSIANNILSTPQYELPAPVFDNKTVTQFYSDNYSAQNEAELFTTLMPNSGWNSTNGYLSFSKVNILNQETKGIYGIFKVKSQTTVDQTLFHIENDLNKNYFSVQINNGNILYKFKYGQSAEQIIYTQSSGYTVNSKFIVAIDIDKLVAKYGSNLALFWGNKNSLKLYVGGNKNFTKTFAGNIYTVGFCNAKNLSEMATLFNADGLVNQSSTFNYSAHVPSYKMMVKENDFNSQIYFDVGVKSSWQSYLPLSYFAKYVTNAQGDQYYDLDFIQLNIGYPKRDIFTTVSGTEYYNTSSLPVRTYISFQTVQSGANANASSFANTKLLPKNGIIEPGEEWLTTKYEFLSDTLVYPPKNVNFEDLAIVTHIEFSLDETINRPVTIKSLQYASQSFNETTPTAIGTRFGKSLYPYKQTGIYFNYKDSNPISIYKGSTPYLYLTKTSGIKVRGELDSKTNRGVSMAVNESLVSDYKIIAMHISALYSEESFPSEPLEVFEIEARDSFIKFFVVSTHPDGKRGKIYAVNAKTGEQDTTIVFYINGKITVAPTLNIDEWCMIGITFPNALIFRNYAGSLRINGKLMINNISYYQSTNLQEIQQSVNRPWNKVESDGTTYDWSFWDASFIWGQVLVISTTSTFGVDASNIYKTYTGTNKIIVDDTKTDTDTTSRLLVQDYQYNVLQNILLQSQTLSAV